MAKGGKRTGAGRPQGSFKFGGPTKVMRVPEACIEDIKRLINKSETYKIPLYMSKVRAGFPSPADDHIETSIDLNEYLIKHPAATFMVRATGDSMINAGIHPGNILIVDRSLEPIHDKIIIAALNGELTVKRLYKKQNVVKLVAENPSYKDIEITQDMEFMIWGVVTNVIGEFK